MVRTIYPQVGGHGLVKGGRGVTGIWVAVVRAAVDKARVAHFRPALWRVHGQCARCSSGVEKRSWSPQSRAACTRGERTGEKGLSFSPKFKKRNGARSAGG